MKRYYATSSGQSLPSLAPSLLIGVPSIDMEHAELVSELDRLLHDDTHANLESEAFSEVLGRLGQQISAHFASEEGIFKSCGMPAEEVAAHLLAHDEILGQYTGLNLDLMEGKALARPEALVMIENWLIGHIAQHDIKIRKYLLIGSVQPKSPG